MFNKCIVVGNLGRDAELRYTSGGHAVCNFSVATTEKWTDRAGEKQSKTEWHRITYWGKGAEAVHQYLTKGKLVLVEGKIETRKWEDKDGNDRYMTEIKADNVRLLGGGGGRREGGHDDTGDDQAPGAPGQGVQEDDSDIPF